MVRASHATLELCSTAASIEHALGAVRIRPASARHARGRAMTRPPAVLERAKGIEPSCAAWKAAVLPLNYARRRGPRRERRPHRRAARRMVARERVAHARRETTRRTRGCLVERARCATRIPRARAPWKGRFRLAGSGDFARERTRELVGRDGFEPSKAEPSDLQSDPFGRSGISPLVLDVRFKRRRRAPPTRARRVAWVAVFRSLSHPQVKSRCHGATRRTRRACAADVVPRSADLSHHSRLEPAAGLEPATT